MQIEKRINSKYKYYPRKFIQIFWFLKFKSALFHHKFYSKKFDIFVFVLEF